MYTPGIQLSNFFSGFLSAGVSADAQQIYLYNVTGIWPDIQTNEDYCYLTLANPAGNQYEIIRVTTVNPATGAISVIRGQDDTAPIAFPAGSTASLCITAQCLRDLITTMATNLINTMRPE